MLSKNFFEKAINELGFDLVDFFYSSHSGKITIYIDIPSKEILHSQATKSINRQINISDCEAVSNHLSTLLAVEDVDFSYLEISSPGINRQLNNLDDYQRFIGQRVKIELSYEDDHLLHNEQSSTEESVDILLDNNSNSPGQKINKLFAIIDAVDYPSNTISFLQTDRKRDNKKAKHINNNAHSKKNHMNSKLDLDYDIANHTRHIEDASVLDVANGNIDQNTNGNKFKLNIQHIKKAKIDVDFNQMMRSKK